MLIKLIQKINRQFKNLLILIYIMPKYKLFNVFKKEKGVNPNNNDKLIISLTSFPKRFNVLCLTIEALLNQSLKPNKIVLWLAEDELENVKIPKSLLKQKARGLTIKIVKQNLRSYNKLIYSLEEFPEYNIITVDDDIIYPTWFIKELFSKSIKYPNSIIAYRCLCINKIAKNTLAKYTSWKRMSKNTTIYNLFFTGVGGVLYPPNTLHKDVLDRDLFLKLSPLADDIWFNAMAILNHTPIITTRDKWVEFPVIAFSQSIALSKSNVNLNKNDIFLKKVFDYYKLYQYIK